MPISQAFRYFVLEPMAEGAHGDASRAALRCYAEAIKAADFPTADALLALLADEEPATIPDAERDPPARPEHTLEWVLDTLRVAAAGEPVFESGYTWASVTLQPIVDQTGIERTALRFRCDVLGRLGLFRWDYSAPGVKGWVRVEDKKSVPSVK